MNKIFPEGGFCELAMTEEQIDYLWLLDQCGFDQHVRFLRHTDVFDRVRLLLMHKLEYQNLTLESSIHNNFLIHGWRLEKTFGHQSAQTHFARFWRSEFTDAAKSNLIHVKLRQIEAGAVPVEPLPTLILSSNVKAVGSKRALLLMLVMPDGILFSYKQWAQNLCFIDQLIEMRPGYRLLHKIRDDYYREFIRLYKSGLRYAKQPNYSRKLPSDELTFYKRLFKFQYSEKRDIFRCLCEPGLNT